MNINQNLEKRMKKQFQRYIEDLNKTKSQKQVKIYFKIHSLVHIRWVMAFFRGYMEFKKQTENIR